MHTLASERHDMNPLLEKLNEYRSINNFKMEYTLSDGKVMDFRLKLAAFPHLIGLQKLMDIPVIRRFNDITNHTVSAKYIISQIKKEIVLTDDIIQNSKYFPDIESRYNNFTKDNLLTTVYTDVIVDFNPALLRSTLKAKYILFEEKNQGYNYFCVAEGVNGIRYAESFFHNPTDLYVRNQKILKVDKVRIFTDTDILYFEDDLTQ